MIHRQQIKKQRILFIVLLTLIIITAFISAGIGYSTLSFNRLLPTFLGQGTFKEEFVLFSVRLPRIIITILAGMALALSGAILQSITRNDLADPGIIGINSGAGVAVSIFFLIYAYSTWFLCVPTTTSGICRCFDYCIFHLYPFVQPRSWATACSINFSWCWFLNGSFRFDDCLYFIC